MNRLFLLGLLSATLIPEVAPAQVNFTNAAGQTVGYTNSGAVANQMIDAVTFVNYGTFVAATVLPFETHNTLNFVNQGIMQSVGGGWRFNHNSTLTGFRSLAASFVNLNPGFIEAMDLDIGPQVPLGLLGEPCSVSRLVPSFMQIWATNISIGGGGLTAGSSLRVGANGIMDLKGQNVDLSYAGLEVLPIWEEVTGSILYSPPITFTNFVPDVGLFDRYFGQASFSQTYALGLIALWDGFVANSPGLLSPPVLPVSPTGTYPGLQLPDPLADAYISADLVFLDITNSAGVPDVAIVFSNEVKGAVFVVAPPAFGVSGGFQPGNEPNNNAQTIGVSLTARLTNSVTRRAETAYINLLDTLASDSRIRGLSANLVGCGEVTARPQNYIVDRQPFSSVGVAGNFGYPDPTFFLDSGLTNFLFRNFGIYETNILYDLVTNFSVIVGDYSAYGMFVANQVSRPAPIPGADITNLPGRITISADRLDLTQTRMRAEGHILIDTPRLISSSNAVIDCENLSFNVSSPTGNLKVQSLIPPNVPRLRGSIRAWSAVWSNTVMMIIENYGVSNTVTTNVPPTTNTFIFYSPLTNLYGVTYHTLMLDASGLQAAIPVSVYGFATRSRDVVIDDNISVVESLLISGRSLTVNSDFRISGIYPPDPVTQIAPPVTAISRWISTNAPNLQFFTNNGTITIATDCHFGDDRLPYSDFVNNSSISAQSIAVGSDYFENNGSLLALSGSLLIHGGTGKLQSGGSSSANLSQFMCGNLKFDNYTMAAGGAITFFVTNSLNDSGPNSSNFFQVNDGFNLRIKPSRGDLLGTTIETIALVPTSLRINHTWAAEDRGPTPAGYADNTAIGTLVVSAPTNSALFVFSGTTSHNALYVDLLDLSALVDYTNQLQINPGLTIYFAAVKVAPSVTLPPLAQAEEFLDGQFAGRLRWVQSYAGPNSTADVIVTNAAGDRVTIPVNSALRNSLIIDSDGDGTANGLQPGLGLPPDPDFSAPPVQTASLTVQIKGRGTVAPDLGGQLLVAGQEYGMVAQPADGFGFSGWTDASGAPITNSPLLTFVMPAGGTNVTANFLFTVAPGAYSGLFYEPEPIGIEFERSGAFTLTTTKNGKFSGSLQLGTKRYSFSGNMDTNGAATVPIRNTSMTLQFQVGSASVSGTVSNGVSWTANLQGGRNGFNAGQNKAPFAGKYTIVFLGSRDPNDTEHPQGDGYGSVNVDASGRVRFSGTLADGTKVTQTTRVTDDREWPFYVAFPNAKGQILSWLTFATMPDQDIDGLFDWIKQPNAKTTLYPEGFSFQADSIGSAYDPATKPLTGFSSGVLDVAGADLNTDVTVGVSVGDDNKVTLSDNKSKISLKKAQGFFSGSVPDPDNARKSIKIKGAILQKRSAASGYFLGPSQSGGVLIGP